MYSWLLLLILVFGFSINMYLQTENKSESSGGHSVQTRRVKRLNEWCRILDAPKGIRKRYVIRTAVIKELDLSYCQVSKTSSTAITYQLLKALADKFYPEIREKMAKCEKKDRSYCNYHNLLRLHLGYGFDEKDNVPAQKVRYLMNQTQHKIIFVRHPLEKFFAGARAHFTSR